MATDEEQSFTMKLQFKAKMAGNEDCKKRVGLGALHTMDHEVVPRKRPILRGTTSVVRVTKILVFMVHGPFTRCKPNVDHEE
jgi:hypothetical protein